MLELYQMKCGGQVAPTQKFVWLGCLDVGGQMMIIYLEVGSVQLRSGGGTPGTPSNSSSELYTNAFCE